MNKKLKSIPSAGTKDDREPQPIDTTSSPAIGNTNVMCSQNEGCIKRQHKNYIMLLEWLAFWGWVIAICLLFF